MDEGMEQGDARGDSNAEQFGALSPAWEFGLLVQQSICAVSIWYVGRALNFKAKRQLFLVRGGGVD